MRFSCGEQGRLTVVFLRQDFPSLQKFFAFVRFSNLPFFVFCVRTFGEKNVRPFFKLTKIIFWMIEIYDKLAFYKDRNLNFWEFLTLDDLKTTFFRKADIKSVVLISNWSIKTEKLPETITNWSFLELQRFSFEIISATFWNFYGKSFSHFVNPRRKVAIWFWTASFFPFRFRTN